MSVGSGPRPLGPGYDLPADAGHAPLPLASSTDAAAPPAPHAGAGPAKVLPPKEPLPSAELELKPGDPMPKKALPPGKRLGRGGVVPPGIPSPARVALTTADRKGALVDVRTGRVLLALPAEPQYVSPRAGVVTLEGQPPRLVRLRDGALITPSIDAGGQSVKTAFVVATDAHPRALALAETTAGDKLAGLASDDLSTFKVSPVPLERSGVRYAATLNAIHWQLVAPQPNAWGDGHGTPYSSPHDETCVRAKVADDGVVTCLEYQPNAGMMGFAWLDDGWLAGDSFVTHVSFGATRLPFDDGPPARSAMCSTRGTRSTPPRAIATCQKSAEAILWAPGKRYTFVGSTNPNAIGGLVGADTGPVLPILDTHNPSRMKDELLTTATRWLDLVGLRLLSSPKLRPLAIASFAGVESRALAEDLHDKTSDVYLLDFEKATRELVARITDCPGVLGELREARTSQWSAGQSRTRWLVLACMTPPAKHSVAQTLIWSEIVDVDVRTRWRTPLMPETFIGDGLVVLSSRRALSAESKTAPGEIFSVDLAGP